MEGNALATPTVATPPAAPVAPVTPPTGPDFSALLRDGKIFGKYDSPDAANRGFWELNNYAAQLAQQVQQLQASVAPTTPAQRSAVQRLADEALINPDLLSQALSEIASTVVDKRFAPFEATLGASSILAREIPDYRQNEQAVQTWLESNPTISQLLRHLQASGTIEGALAGQRLAYREWQASQVPATTPAPAAVAAAALPGGTGTATPAGIAPAAPPVPNADLNQAFELYGHTGDPRAVHSALFRDFDWFAAPGESALQ